MTVALTVLFWMLAASRVWMTWRSGWRHWRSALTFATVAMAGVVTVYLWRSRVDASLGIPNVAGLIGRLLVISGLIAVQWSLTWPSRQGRQISGALGILSLGSLVLAWAAAPFHATEIIDYAPLMAHRAVQVYTLLFYGEVFAILTQLVIGFLDRRREAAESGDVTARPAFALASLGSLLIMATMVAWSLDVLHWTRPEVASTAGRVLLLAGASILGLGLTWVPVGAWIQSQRGLLAVSTEWRRVVAAHPEVMLEGGVWDRLVRPEVVLVRRLIELEDASARAAQ